MASEKTMFMRDNDTLKWEHDGKLYCLHVQDDSYPLNPRKDGDHPGTVMGCWNRRHDLGDKIEDESMEEFWQRLVRENVPNEDVLEAALAGKLKGIRLAINSENPRFYDIYETTYWRTALGNSEPSENLEYEGIPGESVHAYLRDDLSIGHCMMLMEPYAVWLDLWLYDHSGITMRCGKGKPFFCQWDSGQVGWIVTTKKSAIEEIGYKENDWRERSISLMEAEVEVYDQYLAGDVYGFTFYEADRPEDDDDEPDWTETDSCWGFFGDDILKNGIAEHIGNGLKDAIEADACEKGEAKLHTVSYYEF